jgi:hypothetical protein
MSSPIVPQIIPIPNRFVKDLTGQRFGRLVALGFAGLMRVGKQGVTRATWLCRCDCGNELVVVSGRLVSGVTQSCGCLMRQRVSEAHRTHGMSGTPEHAAWLNIRNRCRNPNTTHYADYGGRGIKVCDRWRDSFADFFADMGPRPSANHTIDRIDNGGDYEPGNCRWATMSEQCNNRRTCRNLTFQGETHTVTEWAQIRGIAVDTLLARVRLGWSVERALTTPVKPPHE